MVLVSHTHRFIFLKTKKTASTTVETYFEPFCLPDPDAEIHEYRDEHVGPTGIVGARRSREKRAQATWHAHMSALDVLRQLGPVRFWRYFRFTTVRNPFAKYLSQFRYRHRGQPVLTAPFADQRRAFNAWMQLRAAEPTDHYIYSLGPVRIANAYVRYEHLRADLAAVCTRLGLPFDEDRLGALKMMSPPERPPADYYDPASRRIVERRHRWEIARFGYDFAPASGAGVARARGPAREELIR